DDPDDRPRKRPRDEDDEDRPRKRRREDDDDYDVRRRDGGSDGGVGYVIPYKNAPALASYYVGILGLLACFIGLGPITGLIAVILGFMGMARASKNPEAHGRVHAIVGIILGFVQLLFGCGVLVFIIMSFMGGRH